jgi:hypothetical protein
VSYGENFGVLSSTGSTTAVLTTSGGRYWYENLLPHQLLR